MDATRQKTTYTCGTPVTSSIGPNPTSLATPRIWDPTLDSATTKTTDFKMSRSTDPGHFFQTDASEAIRARRAAKSGNKNGDPIKLTSKILDVVVDPLSPTCLFVAESAGCIRKVNLEVGEPTHLEVTWIWAKLTCGRYSLKIRSLFIAVQLPLSPRWLLAGAMLKQYSQDAGIKTFGAGTGRLRP